MAVLYAEAPEGAETLFTTMAEWRELSNTGSVFQSYSDIQDDASLMRPRDQKERFDELKVAAFIRQTISKQFAHAEFEDIDQKRLARLVQDLDLGNARVFYDREDNVVKVRDVVVVHLLSPEPSRAGDILYRETQPRGLPHAIRSATESIYDVGLRAIKDNVPQFLQGALNLEPWGPEHGFWAIPDPPSKSTNVLDPGSRSVPSKAWVELPSLTRFFVLRATFDISSDPFVFLRAGIGAEKIGADE